MDTALFDYDLPPEAIAQVPAVERDQSRLLIVHRATGLVQDAVFRDLGHYLEGPYHFVRNRVAVLRARLHAERPTGGAVECLLLHPTGEGDNVWWCLLKPGRRLDVGAEFGRPGAFTGTVVAKGEDGACRVRFSSPTGMEVAEIAERFGEMPLPPYIERTADDPRRYLDNERYQTVYVDPSARRAVAAPTAGLHFTAAVIEDLTRRGHQFFDLTLHVGLGTFRPIQAERVTAHQIHREWYEIPPETQRVLTPPRTRPVLAVGTTSFRAAEDFLRHADPAAPTREWRREADLFVYPPATFGVEALLTNFHLPRSTLLCLVAAFLTPGSTGGVAWVKDIYQAALKRGYRFYSYGDAMLIL